MPPAPERPPLTHSLLIGARLHLHAYIRYGVALAIIMGMLFARHVLGWSEIDVVTLSVVAVVIVAYNTVALLLVLPYRVPARADEARRFLLTVMYITVVLDYLCLTVSIWAVGGSRSPFLAFYLFHVMIGCLLFTRPRAVAGTVLAYALLTVLVMGEWSGFIPPRVPLGASITPLPPDGHYTLIILTVYAVLFGLSTFLLVGTTKALRRGERELMQLSIERERLSTLRRDFLHMASHNLRSPVGAAAMLLGNLRDGLAGELNEKQAEWTERSLHRLEDLSEFLRDLQMLAELQSAEVMDQASDIPLGPMLSSLVEENRDLAAERGHRLEVEVEEDLRPVRGIDRLLREAVVNYITNAIKYTPESGSIVVRALNEGRMVRVEVQDNGSGIQPADQSRLFQEFVRLGGGAKGESGTGLGLSIVRRIVEMHGGEVGVTSRPGEGATFHILLPAL